MKSFLYFCATLTTMTTKRNSLLFKIKLENEEADFNVNNFIDLFLENGIFESYLNMVFGIATHNYILKIFNVTFKETTPKSIIEDIYETFKEPQEVTSNDNIDFTIQVNRPPGYRQFITLYPMPFDVDAEILKAITKNWGISNSVNTKNAPSYIILTYTYILKISTEKKYRTRSSSLLNPLIYLDNINSFIPNEVLQTLPSSPLITQNEIRLAIQSLNQNSALGLDVFTLKLYISFSLLILILCQTFNNSYLRKQLTRSQSLALIKLIPKIPNPISVKDWPPISLLNTDYKILSTIISSRLKPILNSVISIKQQCGLPNRQIFNNHLNILSAINYTNDFIQPFAILQIDFYKAFDTISHEFILSTASKLGIPISLLNWIRIFLSDLTAQLNLNSYLSDPISVKCGICQGCPLSKLLFLIGIEPLTKKNTSFI